MIVVGMELLLLLHKTIEVALINNDDDLTPEEVKILQDFQDDIMNGLQEE